MLTLFTENRAALFISQVTGNKNNKILHSFFVRIVNKIFLENKRSCCYFKTLNNKIENV